MSGLESIQLKINIRKYHEVVESVEQLFLLSTQLFVKTFLVENHVSSENVFWQVHVKIRSKIDKTWSNNR